MVLPFFEKKKWWSQCHLAFFTFNLPPFTYHLHSIYISFTYHLPPFFPFTSWFQQHLNHNVSPPCHKAFSSRKVANASGKPTAKGPENRPKLPPEKEAGSTSDHPSLSCELLVSGRVPFVELISSRFKRHTKKNKSTWMVYSNLGLSQKKSPQKTEVGPSPAVSLKLFGGGRPYRLAPWIAHQFQNVPCVQPLVMVFFFRNPGS